MKYKTIIISVLFTLFFGVPFLANAQSAVLYDATFDVGNNGTSRASIFDAFSNFRTNTGNNLGIDQGAGVGLNNIPNTGLENPFHLSIFITLILLSVVVAYQVYRVQEEGKEVQKRKNEVQALYA